MQQLIKTRDELSDLLKERVFIHPDEVELFCRYASEAKRVIVEIGTGFGATAALFLLHKPFMVRLFSIDPFVKDSMGNWQATLARANAAVYRVLDAKGLRDNIGHWTIFEDTSNEVVKNWTLPIDLLFIDGDHSYEAVRADFDNWSRFVKKGGAILVHDSCAPDGTPPDVFDAGWPGPTRLANELREDSRVQLIETSYSLSCWRMLDGEDNASGDSPQPKSNRRRRTTKLA